MTNHQRQQPQSVADPSAPFAVLTYHTHSRLAHIGVSALYRKKTRDSRDLSTQQDADLKRRLGLRNAKIHKRKVALSPGSEISELETEADDELDDSVIQELESCMAELEAQSQRSKRSIVIGLSQSSQRRMQRRIGTFNFDRAPVRAFITSGGKPPFSVEMGTAQHLTQKLKSR